MIRPARARAAAVLTALTLLAGCTAPPPTPTPSPSATTSSAAPTADPTIATDQKLEATGHVPRVLDTALLDALPVTVDTRSSLTSHLFAAWPEFDREVADTMIRRWFNGQVDAFLRDYAGAKGSANPELNLGWHLVASSPQVIGLVADGYLFAGASGQNVWQSMWFDPAADRWLDADELADPTALRGALTQAATASGIDGIDLAGAGDDPVAAATLVAFRPTGELIVGYDECAVAPCSAGRVTLTIARTATDGLLTEAGRAAQAATVNPSSPVAGTGSTTPSSAPATTSPASSAPASTPTTPTPTRTAGTGQVDCKKVKCVALTFDDGPGPYTSKLLGYLAAKDVHATFFMLGQQVQVYPKVAAAVAAGGHEIGVHTWDHRSLPELSNARIGTEISSTVSILRKATGVNPTLLRPPYGATNSRVAAIAKQQGLAEVMWSVDTLDWKTRSTAKTIAAAKNDTRRGSIILVHDIHPTTVEAVPGIIDALQAKGYHFVTVTQLLGDPKPGRKYFSGS